METDRKWIVVRIDGKLAAVSTDYRLLASISANLAGYELNHEKAQRRRKPRKSKPGKSCIYGNISAESVGIEEIWRLRKETRWDDLMLFGTEFQKKVWRKLWELTHPEAGAETEVEAKTGTEQTGQDQTSLICYSDFAELCQNRAGVRAVAHAIGLNPISVIIPCHLVIPKESIDKIRDIHKKAEATIFKGDDLCINSILSDSSIDFGEYALGRKLKRELILRELA
jgi:O6-methylguanine-DNA--protein-cysteine methyltransferase